MKYLKVYTDFAEELEPLSDIEVGRLFRAMLKYAGLGEASELHGNERFVWPTAKKNIDRTREESEKKKSAGSSGGLAKASNAKQGVAEASRSKQNLAYKDKDKDKDKDKEKDKEKGLGERKGSAQARFVPPSIADVREYCEQRGSSVDPEAFVAFYASKGWKVGVAPMKDWKHAIVTWEKRETKHSSAPEDRFSNLRRLEEMYRGQ